MYFPIRVSFRVSEGKNGENKNCVSCPTYVYVVIMRSILIFCYFPMLCFSPVSPCYFPMLCYVSVLSFVVDAVFFADLPILLPSVGLSSLLCVIIRLGVFRGSEAKKWVLCCACVVYIRKKGGRDICVPHPPYVFGLLFPVQE